MGGEDTAVFFAERIESLLRGVLGQPDMHGSYAQLYETEGARKTVISHVGSGITLTGEGKGVLRLQFSYEYEINAHGYLTIEKSSIRILPQNEGYLGAPFFHYDYLRDHHGDVPAAHINIHASNDEMTKTMLQCGLKKRGRRRREKFVKNYEREEGL
ncbi:hypothetical protein [Alloscardovia macacae]|uniref:Uncharacterized protein n=1 Tax=Alloscardovia macacae TaxID=1160091 RepID=A0A261F786_9BIFI|nr:hypothetical protein [Alloscardovia macacae]OZG54954.1 hypothetical protein ALMA_0279 [Alloscardovia macacae]